MNKKASDKIISVYWFAILFIVAGAMVYIAGIFYGTPYDVRELESNALLNQVATCLTNAGHYREDINLIVDENFLDVCNIVFDVEDIYVDNRSQYYIEVNSIDFQTTQGDSNLKDLCAQEGKTLPVCLERSFYVYGINEVKQEIKILTVVRKTEKNV